MIPYSLWPNRRRALYGMSYFTENELEVIVFEVKENHSRIVARESIPTPGGQAPPVETTAHFRDRLRSYQAQPATWIHLALRNAAFVRFFSLTQGSREEMEERLSKRIQAEIPYLAEEAISHRIFQPSEGGEAVRVLLFGISKNVLADQLKRLESFGITPRRVMLSTEILNWIYQRRLPRPEPAEHSELVIHFFGAQAELLIFEKGTLLQSRWISQGNDPTNPTIREGLKTSLAAFQREWRRTPEGIRLLGPSPTDLGPIASELGLKLENNSVHSESDISPLLAAAVDLHSSDEVFDFTLPQLKQAREEESRTKKRSRLALSFACFSFSLFFLAWIQASVVLAQMGWVKFQRVALVGSVKEVKQLREKALAVRGFYKKKSLPIQLLGSLRGAIPGRVQLEELLYNEGEAVVTLRGLAPQQALVDQFVASLGQDPLFARCSLERVQAEGDKKEEVLYHFSIKGVLKGDKSDRRDS